MRDNTNAESVHEYHQGNRPKVVVAIPCFNVEPYIKEVVSKASRYADQVIVVDDGSEDRTAEVARASVNLRSPKVSTAGGGSTCHLLWLCSAGNTKPRKQSRSGGTRTPALRFWRPLLSQTELHSYSTSSIIAQFSAKINKYPWGDSCLYSGYL